MEPWMDIDEMLDLEQQLNDEKEEDFYYPDCDDDNEQNNDNNSQANTTVVIQSIVNEHSNNPPKENVTSYSEGRVGALRVAAAPYDDKTQSKVTAASMNIEDFDDDLIGYSVSRSSKTLFDPKEMGLQMQRARENFLNEFDKGGIGANGSNVICGSNLITEMPAYTYVKQSASYLFKRPPDDIGHLTCVLGNGSRFFLKRRSSCPENVEQWSSNTTTPVYNSSVGGLLSKSMDDLIAEAKELEVQLQATKKNQQEEKDTETLYGTNTVEYLSDGGSALWVDKYAPRSFTQLLSSEKTNREVLAYLKEWDKFVFRDKPVASIDTNSSKTINACEIPKQVRNAFGNYTSSTSTSSTTTAVSSSNGKSSSTMVITKKAKPTQKVNSKNDNHENNSDDDDIDNAGSKGKHSGKNALKDLRPAVKIVLLAGPPGTGKTTLAHVLAKHCGYRAHEVNASDDRSYEKLKDTLFRCMQGNTLDADRRPNCIILDEIDGIDGKAPIDLIVNIAKMPLGSKTAGLFPLTRPLICVCNDQYAPSLRELRKAALVFVFQPPSELRLVQRLRQICSQEGIGQGVSANAITALSNSTGNDIRSSINTLQFAALKASHQHHSFKAATRSGNETKGSIGVVLAKMIGSGLKDEQRDAMRVWKEIFSRKAVAMAIARKKEHTQCHWVKDESPKNISRSSTKSFMSPSSSSSKASLSISPTMHVMNSMVSYGDNSLIIRGIHENMNVQTICSDPNCHRVQHASEWMSFLDQVDRFTLTCPDGFQVAGYLSLAAPVIHNLLASDSGKLVEVKWPYRSSELYYARQQRENIVQTIISSAFHSKVFCSKAVVAMDVLPLLLDVVSPFRVRALPFITLSTQEQEAINEVVKVMAACGLTYVPSKIPLAGFKDKNLPHYDGSAKEDGYGLVLDPAIADVVVYRGSAADFDEIRIRRMPSMDMPTELKRTIKQELLRYLVTQHHSHDDGINANAGKSDSPKTTLKDKSDIKSHTSLQSSVATVGTANPPSIAAWHGSAEDKMKMESAIKASNDRGNGPVPGQLKSFLLKRTQPEGKKRSLADDKALSVGTRKDKSIEANSSEISLSSSFPQLPPSKKQKLFFKFCQGFSNAVRRPVTIKEFC